MTGAAIVALAAIVPLARLPSAGIWIAALLAGVGVALPLWVLLGTHYTLTDSTLQVRSGPFRWRIPLSEINGIEHTRSPLSSPALSLDRLQISYGRGSLLMISPRDRDAFMRELAARGVAAAATAQLAS